MERDMLAPTISSSWEPTAQLRWVPLSSFQAHRLKLQQAWNVTHYEDSRPVKIETEWRDVPTVSNEE